MESILYIIYDKNIKKYTKYKITNNRFAIEILKTNGKEKDIKLALAKHRYSKIYCDNQLFYKKELIQLVCDNKEVKFYLI